MPATLPQRWQTPLGVAIYVALLAAGYYYNLTLVQLGLIDLGTRVVGLTDTAVSAWMAVLALATLAVAVATGVAMDRRGWSRDLRLKLRVVLAVVTVQFLLTLAAPGVRTRVGFGAWILAAAVALGVGFPVSVSLAVELVPVPHRGPVAAAVTAVAYFAANAIPLSWSIDVFSRVLAVAMAPAILVLAVALSGRLAAVERVLDGLEAQREAFGTGRFCRPTPVATRSLAFLVPVALVFAVFFVDSLGFLRIIDTPALLLTSWQSPELSTRLLIALAHVVGAGMAAVVYVNYPLSRIVLLTLALFALTHVLYTFDLRIAAAVPQLATRGASPLNPAAYAVAVSFYTTLNFALWPDLSTPDTIGTHAAIGIGVAGWLATFASTALALYFRASDLPLLTHLDVVQALSLLLVFGLGVGLYARRMHQLLHGRAAS